MAGLIPNFVLRASSGVTQILTEYRSETNTQAASRSGRSHQRTEAYEVVLSKAAQAISDAEQSYQTESAKGLNIYTR